MSGNASRCLNASPFYTLDNLSIHYRGYLDYTLGDLNVQGGGEDVKDVTSAMDQIDIGDMFAPKVSIAIREASTCYI
jgi:hypothetical protein